MNTPQNREQKPEAPPLQNREQRILSELDRLFHDIDLKGRFKSVTDNGSMTSFPGLVQRSGLLQTVLFALGKSKEPKQDQKPKQKQKQEQKQEQSDQEGVQGWTQALEVVSTVLHALWPEVSPLSPEVSLFSAVDKNPKVYRLNPVALGKQDLITYQRLQLEALEVAGLTARYAAALKAIRPVRDTRSAAGGAP
jgi:hypothetical protein